MVDLEAKHPGERENSLFASVELSLRRLPVAMQETVKRLAVVHGGGQLHILKSVMEVDDDEVQQIALALIEVGVAEDRGRGYLHLDPALPAYWQQGMTAAELAPLRQRWAEAMMQLVGFLLQQQNQDTKLQATLTLLELPNLRALLDWMTTMLEAKKPTLSPEQVTSVAGPIEQLLQNLGRPQALAHAVAVRELASTQVGAWSTAQFQSQAQTVERLLQRGDALTAYQAAVTLQERAVSAGEDAYTGADYNIAYAYWLLGRVLRMGGQASAALPLFQEAQSRFERIAETGVRDTARNASGMVAATIAEQANCLRDLGQLEAAATAYERNIELAKQLDDGRQVATGQFQLGTVHMLQQRYDEALAIYAQARTQFEALGEPQMLATAWHRIGMVHSERNAYFEAEDAYRQALSIDVQSNNLAGQAHSLNELGNLYDNMGRLEEAVVYYRQAAEIDVALQNLRGEGLDRSNIANTLVKLHRYDEARTEIIRAIECKQRFGHVAEPWKTWAILHGIETAVGNTGAAQAAWQQARSAYLAYRRDGGYAQFGGGRLCEQVLSALQAGQMDEMGQVLTEVKSSPDVPTERHPLIDKLQAIVAGSRDGALADDMALDPDDAAEILLLMERLAETGR
ncbi:MAG: tetratricopeptide repeat protein [Chloroflexota bacterium]